MKLFTFIIMILISFNLQANDCTKWEYSQLSLTSKSILNGDVLEKVDTFVFWNSNNEFGYWQNNEPMGGAIKAKLTEFFSIKTVHSISMLNSLGMKGWEAYGYESTRESETDQHQSWQFRKCKI